MEIIGNERKIKKTILLVEDDYIIALSEQEQLEKYNYNVIHVGSGKDAVKTALEKPDIDLILMDINLSDEMGGTQAAEIILKEKDIPIVFLSSHTEPEIVEKTENITSYGYVVKDTGITILDTSIKMALKLFYEKIARNQIELELKNSKLITENIPLGLYLYHLEDISDDRTLRMIYANPVVKDLTGIGPEEVVGRTLDENFPGLRSQGIPQKYAEIVRSNKTFSFEEIVYGDNRVIQSSFSVMAFPLPGNHVGIAFDNITDRKKTEEELIKAKEKAVINELLYKEKHELLSLFLKHSPIYAFIKEIEPNQSRVLYASDNYNEMIGISGADMIGKTMYELFPPEFAEKITKDDITVTENGEILKIDEDLGDRNYITIKFPIIQKNNKLLAGYTIDITDRKEFERELKTSKEKAEYNEKIVKQQLKEKEALLKEVHHRVKNNIANIKNLLLLQAKSNPNPYVRTALNETSLRVDSMLVLYQKLLIGKNYHEISFKNYIESLIESIVEIFPESSKITIEKKIDDFIISGKKASSVGIILNELLTNIFKYAFINKDNCKILIEIKKIDNLVIFTIIDNGVGIDDRIKSNKSEGFGLTIVRMLSEQLDGTFKMENDNGTKSSIEFKL